MSLSGCVDIAIFLYKSLTSGFENASLLGCLLSSSFFSSSENGESTLLMEQYSPIDLENSMQATSNISSVSLCSNLTFLSFAFSFLRNYCLKSFIYHILQKVYAKVKSYF